MYRGKDPNGNDVEIQLSKDVAIVGSSKEILNRRWGEKINKHQDIIRINKAPLKGYEAHVGDKTTIMFLNSGFELLDLIPPYKGMTQLEALNTIMVDQNSPKIIYHSPSCVPVLNEYRKKNPITAIKFKSDDKKIKNYVPFSCDFSVRGGVRILIQLITMGYKPHLYGFDTIRNNQQYYNDHKTFFVDATHKPHNVYKEMELITNMFRSHLITLHKDFYIIDTTLSGKTFSTKDAVQIYKAISDAGIDYCQVSEDIDIIELRNSHKLGSLFSIYVKDEIKNMSADFYIIHANDKAFELAERLKEKTVAFFLDKDTDIKSFIDRLDSKYEIIFFDSQDTLDKSRQFLPDRFIQLGVKEEFLEEAQYISTSIFSEKLPTINLLEQFENTTYSTASLYDLQLSSTT